MTSRANNNPQPASEIVLYQTEYYDNVVDAGELELDLAENKMLFKMLLQDTWEENIALSLA